MKKLFLIVVVPLIMGGVGFAAGVFQTPAPAPAPAPPQDYRASTSVAVAETLYKLPLGKFTIQVMQPGRIVHIRIDLDVYVANAGEFEKINGAEGRAYLRDATTIIISDLAESTLWVEEGREKDIDKDDLAKQIAQKIHRDFPMVRAARIKKFDTTRSARL